MEIERLTEYYTLLEELIDTMTNLDGFSLEDMKGTCTVPK